MALGPGLVSGPVLRAGVMAWEGLGEQRPRVSLDKPAPHQAPRAGALLEKLTLRVFILCAEFTTSDLPGDYVGAGHICVYASIIHSFTHMLSS